jgi:hypothetical protein
LKGIDKIFLVEIMTGNFGYLFNYHLSHLLHPGIFNNHIYAANEILDNISIDRNILLNSGYNKLEIIFPVLYTGTNYKDGMSDTKLESDHKGLADIKNLLEVNNSLIVNIHPGPARKINYKFNDLFDMPAGTPFFSVMSTTTESFLISAFWFANCYYKPGVNEPLDDNYEMFVNRITDYYIDGVGKTILNHRKEKDVHVFDINDIIYNNKLDYMAAALSNITGLSLIGDPIKTFNDTILDHKFIKYAVQFVNDSKSNGIYDRVKAALESRKDFLNTISECNIIRG